MNNIENFNKIASVLKALHCESLIQLFYIKKETK